MVSKDGMTRKPKSAQSKPTVFSRVPVRRPAKVAFRAGPTPGLKIDHIEACQSVQSRDNAVTMVGGKATMVRVYLDDTSVTSPLNLRGELVWRRTENGPANFLAAINEIKLDPSNPMALEQQRLSLKASLNFRLPEAAIRAGKLFIELNRVTQTGGSDQPINGKTKLELDFASAPPLRVRAIGLRYKDQSGDTFTPDAVHFDYLRSYLQRAYPVAGIEWSQIVVDANFSPPLADAALFANAQLAAIRNTEINSGMDPRTHYYGLVDDGNGGNFMRGLASGIPATAMPDTVASGPCGIPNGFAGDNDLSYADWYGAHELGHTFGRYHPGYPVGGQDKSDLDFPYENGQISDADQNFVGYDMGDENLGLPLRVLSGTTHHDVMTYQERQWVSAYTFEAIRLRLLDEDQQFAPAGS